MLLQKSRGAAASTEGNFRNEATLRVSCAFDASRNPLFMEKPRKPHILAKLSAEAHGPPPPTPYPFSLEAKLLESSHAWLGASTSSIAADYTSLLKLKAPTWTRHDLQEAIEAVVTQKMRFTQASTKYGIPKGTLYDNILGKSKRMMVLEEAGLNSTEETAVLEFCCDISVSPYNRRTKKSLNAILNFVEKLRRKRDPGFVFTGLSGFRWWWAFCKKHSIVSLYFNDENENE
ncbi:hypothetical protein KPH14_010704 [Odynerus spinipes]|uniref:HTH psq-type domain-containing protein n=1 Tax=Odynerus spinipes TaxID=1348599 RepID=A0AAD9RUX5_9HYME|nr:hypothetical protein KPH14_010704 [Odynerus spinipes]